MRLEFSEAARADLYDIAAYIAQDSPERTLSFVDELEQECQKLTDFPATGTARPEIQKDVRSKPYGAYVIFYDFSKERVRIKRVLHGARNIDDIAV